MTGEAKEHEEERVHGVSLAQLAAVHAALAEPFPIRRVLAVEGLEGGAFRQAEAGWKQRMAGDAVTLSRYQAELAAAEDRLVRIVSPLHEDVEAWAMFQAAYMAHPAEVLKSTELGRNDVSRLQRFWAAQMKADESLETRAAEVMARGPVGLPAITAAPRELRPSREGRGGALSAKAPVTMGPQAAPNPGALRAPAAARAAPPAASVDVDAAGLDAYAELVVDLEDSPGDAARVLAEHGLPSEEARAALARKWEARFAEEPVLRRDFRMLTAHYRAQRENSRARGEAEHPAREPAPSPISAPEPLPYAAPPPAADPDGTMDVGAILSRPALPFVPGSVPPAGPPSVKPAFMKPMPAEPRETDSDPDRTMDVGAILSRPALPFTPGARPVVIERDSRPPPRAPAADGDETMNVGQFLSGPALPFTAAPSAPPEPPELSLEQYASLCVDLRHDPEDATEILGRYGLTPASGPVVDARWRARCADPAVYAAFTRATQAYEAWLAQNGPPSLSVEQYASLTVDLLMDVRHRGETLARYGVAEPQMAALDAAWTARLARDPAARAAFDRAVARYREWLSQRGR